MLSRWQRIFLVCGIPLAYAVVFIRGVLIHHGIIKDNTPIIQQLKQLVNLAFYCGVVTVFSLLSFLLYLIF